MPEGGEEKTRIRAGDRILFTVEDQQLQEELGTYDGDGDGELTLEELGGADHFLEVMADFSSSFLPPSRLSKENPESNPPPSEKLIAHLNDLFQRVENLHRVMANLDQKRFRHSYSAGEMEFRAEDWEEVFRETQKGGVLTTEFLELLKTDMYQVIQALAGRPDAKPEKPNSTYQCFYSFEGFVYLESAIPSAYRDRVALMVERYLKTIKWLGDYHQVECEDWWALWRGRCPANDEVDVRGWSGHRQIRAGGKNEDIFEKDCMDKVETCFPPDARVLLENGATLTFADLKDLEANGQKFPKMASFDESSARIVYQQPARLVEHLDTHSTILSLNLRKSESGGEAAALQVTPNHLLLAERNGAFEWVAAGELKTGDLLVEPAGDHYRFEGSSLFILRGAEDVFDLSFDSPRTGLIPNFLVSADGENWFVAHNKRL